MRSELAQLPKERLMNVFQGIPYMPGTIDRHWLALRESILQEIVTKEDYIEMFDR